jgi:hypothetical protein
MIQCEQIFRQSPTDPNDADLAYHQTQWYPNTAVPTPIDPEGDHMLALRFRRSTGEFEVYQKFDTGRVVVMCHTADFEDALNHGNGYAKHWRGNTHGRDIACQHEFPIKSVHCPVPTNVTEDSFRKHIDELEGTAQDIADLGRQLGEQVSADAPPVRPGIVYRGVRVSAGKCTVYVVAPNTGIGPEKLDLIPSLAVKAHSPTGFEWGYLGSGPSQLALALLLDVSGRPDAALAHHQQFKEAYVAGWHSDHWELYRDDIVAWLERAEGEGD